MQVASVQSNADAGRIPPTKARIEHKNRETRTGGVHKNGQGRTGARTPEAAEAAQGESYPTEARTATKKIYRSCLRRQPSGPRVSHSRIRERTQRDRHRRRRQAQARRGQKETGPSRPNRLPRLEQQQCLVRGSRRW